MLRSALLTLLLLSALESSAQNAAQTPIKTESFVFEVDGKKLDGLFDSPTTQDPVSTIIIVHGYGETNVVEQNWFYELRSKFGKIGINTLIWDKPGCGNSEGEFDINQPVQSSAEEVVAAVKALKERQVKGTETIGLWGISRAGWIAPLAMQEDPSIAFWISVSGTDDKENARYLLESNFLIEGRTAEETELLVSQWQGRFNAAWKGGSYDDYLAASTHIADDEFMHFMGWGGTASEQEFLAYQARFKSGELVVDEKDELLIYVPEFKKVLASIDRPVLALFGEKDTNVDWRKTSALYRETIGRNPDASLEVRVFPDGDHTLRQTRTGGIRELLEQQSRPPYVEGYYESMLSWLKAHQFGEGTF